MKALVVYCHPNPESFSAHLRDTVVDALKAAGHDVRLVDLYDEEFNPVMSRAERLGYHTRGDNEKPVSAHIANLKWADTLLFVYPTWWFGLPAVLKGWLDRVLVPFATFILPTEGKPMQPMLQNIRKIVVVTTCGARWWQSKLVGEPGRKTLLRGMRYICNARCSTQYAALYGIDTSTQAQREAYVARVRRLIAAV